MHHSHRLAFVGMGLFLVLILPVIASAHTPISTVANRLTQGAVTYYDRADFNADAPGLPVEDWEAGHVSGPFVFCTPPLNAMSNDACFLPGEILSGLEYRDVPLGGGSDHVGLGAAGLFSMPSKFVYANYSVDSSDLVFTPTVTAVGLDISGNAVGATILLSAYDANDTLILTDTTSMGDIGSIAFWGVISSVPIRRLNVNMGSSEFVDNIAFGGAVPPITPTASPTNTPSVTATPSPTNTPTATPTASLSATPTATPEPPTSVSVGAIQAELGTPAVPWEWGIGLALITVVSIGYGRRRNR
jgi:hypothetical protein